MFINSNLLITEYDQSTTQEDSFFGPNPQKSNIYPQFKIQIKKNLPVTKKNVVHQMVKIINIYSDSRIYIKGSNLA